MKLVLVIQATILFFFLSSNLAISLATNNVKDRLAFLAIKEKISSDPLKSLSSWNDSLHFCDQEGVSCGRRHRRVTGFKLRFGDLTGTLSPHIADLSFLKYIDHSDNALHGVIPNEIGRPHYKTILVDKSLSIYQVAFLLKILIFKIFSQLGKFQVNRVARDTRPFYQPTHRKYPFVTDKPLFSE